MEKLTYENQGFVDRVQRAESWVAKAQAIEDWEDHHGQFIFYWIALNALCGRDKTARRHEEDDLKWFLGRVCDLDRGAIHSTVLAIKTKADRLLKDQFLVEHYWSETPIANVNRVIDMDFDDAQKAWGKKKIETYLEILLKRLRVLRNQIFHGCSTDRRSVNKTSLVPSLEILETLIPQFLETMKRHGKHHDWPKIPYPRKDSPQHPRS